MQSFHGKTPGTKRHFFSPLRRKEGSFSAPRGLGKTLGRSSLASGNLHGRRPRQERRTDETQSTVFLRRRLGRRRGRKNSGPRRRMRLSAHGRARKPAGHLSPQRGRNQKNGRTLRSGMTKKDARFSNKKAARPHEDSARTSRLTGKAVSDRS